MIDFVLEGAGEQLGAFQLDGFAVEILGADTDFRGAHDFVADVRKAKAAFFLDLLPFPVDDLRIDEDDFVVGVLLIAEVDDRDALADANLGRGEADADSLVHGLEHVGGERTQLVVEFSNRFGGALEDGVGIFDDGANHFNYASS